MPAPSTGADCDLILPSVLLLWNESSLGPSLWTKWNSLLFLMNGILNLTLFTLLPSDWLNQRYRRQWRENTAFRMYLISWSLARQYFTEFYFAISIGKIICKKGIEFRDSSVFDFVLLFKKSELLKNSRQGTCTNLTIQIEKIGRFSTPYMKSLQILISSRQKVQNETF